MAGDARASSRDAAGKEPAADLALVRAEQRPAATSATTACCPPRCAAPDSGQSPVSTRLQAGAGELIRRRGLLASGKEEAAHAG